MSDRESGSAALGADLGDLLFVLALSLMLWGATKLVDHGLDSPPRPELEAVGIVADGHHIDMGAIYGSFARESSEGGALRVHNHQTSEPHGPTLARPWDWLVGKLTWGSDPRRFFNVERLLALLLFPLGCALLLGECLVSRWWRRGALLARRAGGSLYWLGAVAGRGWFRQHLASWLNDIGGLSGLGFAYPALLVGVPHLALEIAFFAGGLGAAARARRTGGQGFLLVSATSLFLLAAVRPYAALPALIGAAVICAHRMPPRGLRYAVLVVLPSLPLLAHQAWVLRGDSVFSALDVVHPAPPLLEQALFCGLPVAALILWLSPSIRQRCRTLGSMPSATRWGLLTCTAALLLIVEGPFFGWGVEAFLPVPLLALLGAVLILRGLPHRVLPILAPALLAAHLIPTVFYAAEVGQKLDDPRAPYWMLADERAAFEFLEVQRPQDALRADHPPVVVLAAPGLGRLVPWLAGVRTFLGHPDHTLSYTAKAVAARAFFRSGSGAGQLASQGVTHVLFSPRVASPDLDPDSVEQLERVFERGAVRLYRVR